MAVKIKKYLKLQTALVNEKARIEARLIEIAQVLNEELPAAASAPSGKGGRRKFSEATKAKMRAAQQARWAKKKGSTGTGTDAAPGPKKKRKMTAAGRAAIAAAAKAR